MAAFMSTGQKTPEIAFGSMGFSAPLRQ